MGSAHLGGEPVRLVALAISHYCEKARWALDRAGIAFAEERHVQGVHVAASRRAGGTGTVPVLVADGLILGESGEIVAWACPDLLTPAASAYAAELDASFGVEGRRWMYDEMLPHRELLAAYNCLGVPEWERALFVHGYPLLTWAGRRALQVVPAEMARAREVVHATFADVAQRLADGRRYLFDDRFTVADLTFACLAAAVLVPPQYGSALPQPEELPTALAGQVRALRAHPAGRFALRLFAEDRR